MAFAPTQNPPSSSLLPSTQEDSSAVTPSNPSNPMSVTNNFSSILTFENASAGIKVVYPSDWKSFGSYHDEQIDIIASFEAPNDRHGRPGVQIISKSLEGHDNLKDYANTYFKDVEKNVKGYKVEEIKTDGVTLSGKPGYEAMISYNICIAQDCGGEEKRGKHLQVGTVNDRGQIIEIVFDSYESEYTKYLPVAEKMIDSLVIN